MRYSRARLTTDAGYNATLGAAFFKEKLGRLDGSFVLASACYNTEPRRAGHWVSRYSSRFLTATSAYIQRVVENYQIYNMCLPGKSNIAGDLVNGR